MLPHEIDWYQRGKLDFLAGVALDRPPDCELFDRTRWADGWKDGKAHWTRVFVRITGLPERRVRLLLRQY